jgi:DHA1 family bicyclomycin/chloramphenicol resistance-like MFS transporter
MGATGAMLTQNFFSFLIFRILQALGCGCFVLVNALIQDFYGNSERHKIRIFTTTAGGLFISTAPLLGTALHLIGGWRGSFIFFVVSSSFIIFTAWRWIPKDVVKDTIREHRGFYAIPKIATNIDFIKYSVLSAIGFSCHFAFIVQSPIIFFEGLSLSQGEFSIVLLTYGIAYLVGGLIAKKTSNKISSRTQVIVGLLIVLFAGTLVSLSALIFPDASIGILASMIICTCGITIVRPAATTLAMEASPLQAGATSSFHNTIIFLMGAAVSIAVTLAPLRPTFNLSVTIMTLSLIGLTVSIFLTARRDRCTL